MCKLLRAFYDPRLFTTAYSIRRNTAGYPDGHPITAVLSHESNSVECHKTTIDALNDLTTYFSQNTDDGGDLILNPTDQDTLSVPDLSNEKDKPTLDAEDLEFNATASTFFDEHMEWSPTASSSPPASWSPTASEKIEKVNREREELLLESPHESDIEESEEGRNARTRHLFATEEDLRKLCMLLRRQEDNRKSQTQGQCNNNVGLGDTKIPH